MVAVPIVGLPMTIRTQAARLSLLPILILLVGCLQYGAAQLGILWRYSVLSWDNPATVLGDEIASQGAVYTDEARQTREALDAWRTSSRLGLPDRTPTRHAGGTGRHLTRSPPDA